MKVHQSLTQRPSSFQVGIKHKLLAGNFWAHV